jgi:CheY-like chemotaxis protein
MIALEGLSYEDAAGRLGIPVGTVRSRLFRARDALRSAVAGETMPDLPVALASGWKVKVAPPRRDPGAGRRPTRPRRVMLVEDELLPAMLLEEIVRDAGFTVVGPVGRLQEAIDLAKAERIDAAVLDIRLDRDMVFPVADILKGRRIPFAFVTAFPESEIKLPHRSRPVWSKPIDRPRLCRGLQSLLDGPGADREPEGRIGQSP